MKRRTLCGILLLVAAWALAGEVWEGNAAQIRRGEFEEEGLFAASNAFGINTKIDVLNPRTGKRVVVMVIKRIEGSSPLFLLLSKKAADAVGIQEGEVERVKVEVSVDLSIGEFAARDEQTTTSDPDFNPTIGLPPDLGRVEEEELAEDTATASEQTEDTVTGSGTEGEEEERSEDTVAAAAPVEEQQEHLAAGPVVEQPVLETERPKADAVAYTPPENLDQPVEPVVVVERADIPEATSAPLRLAEAAVVFATVDPTPPEEVMTELPAVTSGLSLPQDKVVEIVPAEPESPAAVVSESLKSRPQLRAERFSLLSVPEPETKRVAEGDAEGPFVTVRTQEPLQASLPTYDTEGFPQEPKFPLESEEEIRIERTEVATAAPETYDLDSPRIIEEIEEEVRGELVMEPTEPRPPQEPEAAEVVLAEEQLMGDALRKRNFYIQLGAYKDQQQARDLQAYYTQYPIEIITSNVGLYKVLVGPLNGDESGTLLFWFQARGFEDAFVRVAQR
jgi:cell division protein FtsN